MRNVWMMVLLMGCSTLWAQEKRADGTLWDNSLHFIVESESIRGNGQMTICVADKNESCIQNLATVYELYVYDEQGKVLVKSIWKGEKKNIKFKQAYPKAKSIEIKAQKPFVVNILTGTRIYMDQPMVLKMNLR